MEKIRTKQIFNVVFDLVLLLSAAVYTTDPSLTD